MHELSWPRRLKLGATAGVAGGVASSLLLWLLVEPVISRAILLEEAGGSGHHAGATDLEHGEIVTRLQQQIGGTIAVVVVALLLGLVFAVTYARVPHRLPGSTDLGRSLSLAGMAFTVLAVAPALAAPANPPGIGRPETVAARTATYLTVIVLSALFVIVVLALHHMMENRGVPTEQRWLATSAAVVAGAVIVLVVPHIEEPIPVGMPAALVWEFRIGSLAQLASMWASIGVVHGFLIHRNRTQLPSRRSFATA